MKAIKIRQLIEDIRGDAQRLEDFMREPEPLLNKNALNKAITEMYNCIIIMQEFLESEE